MVFSLTALYSIECGWSPFVHTLRSDVVPYMLHAANDAGIHTVAYSYWLWDILTRIIIRLYLLLLFYYIYITIIILYYIILYYYLYMFYIYTYVKYILIILLLYDVRICYLALALVREWLSSVR